MDRAKSTRCFAGNQNLFHAGSAIIAVDAHFFPPVRRRGPFAIVHPQVAPSAAPDHVLPAHAGVLALLTDRFDHPVRWSYARSNGAVPADVTDRVDLCDTPSSRRTRLNCGMWGRMSCSAVHRRRFNNSSVLAFTTD